MELQDLWRLLAAVAAGAVIGLERELHEKPAGFRTNILICAGAALFTVISMRLGASHAADPTRISAQIVSGIGFLGAGAILQRRDGVTGLTTAATIWAVASIGMAFGAGYFLLGLLATALIAGVLFGLGPLEHSIAEWRTTASIELRVSHSGADLDAVRRSVEECNVRIRSWKVWKEPEYYIISGVIWGSLRAVQRVSDRLLRDEQVLSFRQVGN